jgi:ribosomal protein S27AE
MKTREEFVLLADEYRKEIRRRSFVMLPAMVIGIIGFVMIAGVMGRYLGNHSPLIGVWILGFFLALFALSFYQTKSQESLARKFELVCPQCSRVLGANLNLVIATHHCPRCGQSVFS